MFHIIFSLGMPMILYSLFEEVSIVGMYFCFMLLVSTLVSRVSPEKLHGLVLNNNLEINNNNNNNNKNNNNNIIPKISTILVYFLTLVGILLTVTDNRGNYNIYSIPVFLVLLMLFVPFSTTGLEYVLKMTDNFVKTSTPNYFRTNEHLVLIGIVFVLFIALFQFSLLEMIKVVKYI